MDKFYIDGPNVLEGNVRVSRSKNAYLPILAGLLLTDKPITLKSLPALRDIRTMERLLQNLGVRIDESEEGTIFNASRLTSHEATYDLVKTMRASIFVLGPLLARMGEAKVSLPGGCAIGTRPIDLHLSNLKKLGAEIKLEAGYVHASAEKLKGANLTLAFPSVGATENLMMAAVLAEGTTVIESAALEPEISDLADFLNGLGAKISGIGTRRITIEGVSSLNGGEYTAIGDRIEAGSYIMGALMSGGDVKVTDFNPKHLEFVLDTLREMGARLEIGPDYVHVKKSDLGPAKVETAPYPGFPTDLQAQFMALAVTIPGASIITEHIFENRFMHVPELVRLGADITLEGNMAVVNGGRPLKAAPVMCTDLRASMALVLAAAVSVGTAEVQRVYHIDRGYDRIDQKLSQLGVRIRRVNE